MTTTQLLARTRPAWSVISADQQTAGRGQRDRGFVSDAGGLYFTAVLPYGGDALAARGFALAVGWAVHAALKRTGIRDIRLRWPNDLMVGSRKVGGILVEQAGVDTLLVGVGVNYSNQPWQADPALRESAGRLIDASGGAELPARTELTARLLRAVGLAHWFFARKRLVGLTPLVNRCWGPPRRVRLELAHCDPPEIAGIFLGIEPSGAVVLLLDEGAKTSVPEPHINRLHEVRA